MSLSLSVRRADLASLSTPMLAVALAPGAGADGELAALDTALGGVLRRTLERRDFRGKRDETLHLTGAGAIERVLLVGTGARDGRGGDTALKRAAAIAARAAHRAGVGRMAWYSGDGDARATELAAVGLSMGAWEYIDLKTPPPPDDRRTPLGEAMILVHDEKVGREGLAAGEAIGAGYEVARRLGMMPGNLCTPDHLADTARDIARRHSMNVTVLGRAEMEKEGMGSFLAVAQGTPQEPRFIVLEHRRGKKGGRPLVLVGKGLCFDSGGISIKPAQGMEHMKFDMSGAGGVLGAMETIGRLGLELDVVALVGSTTNMPSATAVKPGDVVRASNGKYIEIINTDAEGRLVLADVLAYAKRFEPAAVIDAATLTGACVVALGNVATGVLGNDDALLSEVESAAARAAEPGWRLPLWDDYRDLIKSDVADLKNSGGRAAGTITAALFLKDFAEGYPWVHLDVAGTAYSETDLVSLPRGPTGTPVGTFVEFVRGRAR